MTVMIIMMTMTRLERGLTSPLWLFTSMTSTIIVRRSSFPTPSTTQSTWPQPTFRPPVPDNCWSPCATRLTLTTEKTRESRTRSSTSALRRRWTSSRSAGLLADWPCESVAPKLFPFPVLQKTRRWRSSCEHVMAAGRLCPPPLRCTFYWSTRRWCSTTVSGTTAYQKLAPPVRIPNTGQTACVLYQLTKRRAINRETCIL